MLFEPSLKVTRLASTSAFSVQPGDARHGRPALRPVRVQRILQDGRNGGFLWPNSVIRAISCRRTIPKMTRSCCFFGSSRSLEMARISATTTPCVEACCALWLSQTTSRLPPLMVRTALFGTRYSACPMVPGSWLGNCRTCWVCPATPQK